MMFIFKLKSFFKILLTLCLLFLFLFFKLIFSDVIYADSDESVQELDAWTQQLDIPSSSDKTKIIYFYLLVNDIGYSYQINNCRIEK